MSGGYTSPQAKALAARTWRHLYWERITGLRLRLKRTVRRDDFEAPAGAEGVAMPPFMDQTRLVLAMRLDHPPAGSEPFDGELHWIEGTTIPDVDDDVELA